MAAFQLLQISLCLAWEICKNLVTWNSFCMDAYFVRNHTRGFRFIVLSSITAFAFVLESHNSGRDSELNCSRASRNSAVEFKVSRGSFSVGCSFVPLGTSLNLYSLRWMSMLSRFKYCENISSRFLLIGRQWGMKAACVFFQHVCFLFLYARRSFHKAGLPSSPENSGPHPNKKKK